MGDPIVVLELLFVKLEVEVVLPFFLVVIWKKISMKVLIVAATSLRVQILVMTWRTRSWVLLTWRTRSWVLTWRANLWSWEIFSCKCGPTCGALLVLEAACISFVIGRMVRPIRDKGLGRFNPKIKISLIKLSQLLIYQLEVGPVSLQEGYSKSRVNLMFEIKLKWSGLK